MQQKPCFWQSLHGRPSLLSGATKLIVAVEAAGVAVEGWPRRTSTRCTRAVAVGVLPVLLARVAQAPAWRPRVVQHPRWVASPRAIGQQVGLLVRQYYRRVAGRCATAPAFLNTTITGCAVPWLQATLSPAPIGTALSLTDSAGSNSDHLPNGVAGLTQQHGIFGPPVATEWCP